MNRQTKKIKLEDKCRDFTWILEQFEANKLYINSSRFSKESFEKFRLFVKATEEVYEGQWDINIEALPNGNGDYNYSIIGVVIYFAELTLKNSRDRQHKITDLFVKVHIRTTGQNLRIEHLSGGRMSISYAENNSNYFHSHLPYGFGSRSEGSTAPFYSSFCRGSGHINNFIADINSEGMTAERLVPFLVQITGLVSWESLEGGPHRKMSDIRVNSNRGMKSNPSMHDSLWLKNKVLDFHRQNELIPEVDFKLENGQYILQDNEKFLNFLTETAPMVDSEKARVICMQDSRGNYYKYGSTPGYTPNPDTSQHKYIFQGEEISFTIESPPDVGDTTNIQYFLHPNVRTTIKQDLEYEINTKKIRQSTIDRYKNEADNASESTESN